MSIELGTCEGGEHFSGDYVAAPDESIDAVRSHLASNGLSSGKVWCHWVNGRSYQYLIFPSGTLPRLAEAMQGFRLAEK